MRRCVPDAYLLAILLTFLSGGLALLFTSAGFLPTLQAWGDGIYGIVAFAMQMILILVTGHALALTPAMNRLLVGIAHRAGTPVQAAMMVALFSGGCCWLNWGFGLIMGGLLALEMARRHPAVDFACLIGAAYSGFVCWHMGLSGSIPLVIATPKHAQNFVEQVTGAAVPVTQSIFQPYNLVPAALIIGTLPFLFALIHPRKEDTVGLPPAGPLNLSAPGGVPRPAHPTFAERLDHSSAINLAFGALGLAYLGWHFFTKGFDLNLNILTFTFFIAGVLLHGKPLNYVKAVEVAMKGAGGIALQFPLYGGIQGIMIGTGLATVLAGWFVTLSRPETFYLFQFWAAGIINLFVPSGGGQWAAQGPITLEAAKMMGTDATRSAMMVAWGDQWTNMLQPFWALPLLGLAKLSARAIMGYTMMTLLWSGLILSVSALMMGYRIW
ncbi:MAG: hypothetical protein RIQ93_215 [Verrucomicrobiota bacterium]